MVAIPTDALYTLVADPFNLRAVGRVFCGQRPRGHRSLPLLVGDLMMAEELARELHVRFYLLARRFWPGPLTIIVPASPAVPLKVTGNTGRLALRQSRSKVANALIDAESAADLHQRQYFRPSDLPVGIEVFGTMDGRVDLVLDGGFCTGGGATTVDVTEPYWRMVKAGTIDEKDIADCLAGT